MATPRPINNSQRLIWRPGWSHLRLPGRRRLIARSLSRVGSRYRSGETHALAGCRRGVRGQEAAAAELWTSRWRRGTVIVTVVPFPGDALISIRPPTRSARSYMLTLPRD